MLIIWGTKTTEKTLGNSQQTYQCGHCNNASNYRIFRRRKWFALFWIPMIPLGSKYFIACPVCNYGREIKKQEADDLVQQVTVQNQ